MLELLVFQLVRHADTEHDRCAFRRIQGGRSAHCIIEYLSSRAKQFAIDRPLCPPLLVLRIVRAGTACGGTRLLYALMVISYGCFRFCLPSGPRCRSLPYLV